MLAGASHVTRKRRKRSRARQSDKLTVLISPTRYVFVMNGLHWKLMLIHCECLNDVQKSATQQCVKQNIENDKFAFD